MACFDFTIFPFFSQHSYPGWWPGFALEVCWAERKGTAGAKTFLWTCTSAPPLSKNSSSQNRLSSPKLEYPAKAAQDTLRSLSPSRECVLPSPPRAQLQSPPGPCHWLHDPLSRQSTLIPKSEIPSRNMKRHRSHPSPEIVVVVVQSPSCARLFAITKGKGGRLGSHTGLQRI